MSSIHNVAQNTLVWVLLAFLMTSSMWDILELDLQTKWQTVEEALVFCPQMLWQTLTDYTVYFRDKATKLFSVAYISCENCINNIFFHFFI